jgi:hypothetical protein
VIIGQAMLGLDRLARDNPIAFRYFVIGETRKGTNRAFCNLIESYHRIMHLSRR